MKTQERETICLIGGSYNIEYKRIFCDCRFFKTLTHGVTYL